MSFGRLLCDPTWPGERAAVTTAQSVTRWAAFAGLVDSVATECVDLECRRVGLLMRPSTACLVTLAALESVRCDVFLLNAERGPPATESLAREHRLAAVLSPCGAADPGRTLERISLPDELPGSGTSSVTILTTGTTGKPRAARHSWASLLRAVRRSDGASAPRWVMTYRPHLYAGVQVLLQCLSDGGTLVVPEQDSSPAAVAELMRHERVSHASATPSYWRRLLLFADRAVLRQIPLRQVTLGGEVVDQQVLDALREVFPDARIAHIYATTESGRCFSVSDGRAGFPAGLLLDPTSDGVELRIDDGELMVRSPNEMQGYESCGLLGDEAGRWYASGDMVELVGDRVYFVGRRSDRINVGGNKVHPLEVERVLRAVRGVADVRAFAKRSSIAGELVACQVVPRPGVDRERLRAAIVASAQARLAPFQRPRIIDFVEEISLERSGKVSRRPQ